MQDQIIKNCGSIDEEVRQEVLDCLMLAWDEVKTGSLDAIGARHALMYLTPATAALQKLSFDDGDVANL